MSKSIFVKTNAKLNLFLKINKKLESGYHSMDMINQSISIYDEIRITKNKAKGINILDKSTSINPKDNLIYKAVKLIENDYDKIDVDIEIIKNIPMQAGLGGGSSNSAGVINAIDKLYNLNLSFEQKINYALNLGADVPFCLYGGSKYVYGIGEKLTDISSDNFLFLVVKPDEDMPTNEAFRLFDKSYKKKRDLDFIKEITEKSKKLDLDFIKNNFYNDFEDVICEKFPIINDIKLDFYRNDADFAMMSGSGTTVFSIFKDDTKRQKAYENMKLKYENIFLANTTEKSTEIIEFI